MKDIFAILDEFGLEVPEDKKDSLKNAVLENYKTVAEVETLQTKLSNAETAKNELKEQYEQDTEKRDKDLRALQKALKDAQVAGNDVGNLTELENELKTLRETYNADKQLYENKLAAQAHEFLVRETAGSVKFSSNSAKDAFILKALADETIMSKEGKLIGFDEFLNSYKEYDPDAFKPEPDLQAQQQHAQSPPSFSSKSGTPSGTSPTEYVRPAIL